MRSLAELESVFEPPFTTPDVKAAAADLLRASERVQDCMIEHHLQFALGRPVTAEDCVFQDVADALPSAQPSLRDILTAIALDPSFRRVSQSGGAL